MVVSVTPSTNTQPTGANAPPKLGGQASADAQQDRFLKLLIAQLKNQDPSNPLDNAQVTSQMAQINTVSGINQLNETMKSIASQLASTQATQSAGMIGRDVLVQSSVLSIDKGVARGAIDLSSDANKVTVQVLSPGGQLLDTLNLGPLTAGRQTFQWDASKYSESGNPSFKVVAANGPQIVAATPLAQDTVTSIGITGTTANLQLKGRAAVAYDAIQAIL